MSGHVPTLRAAHHLPRPSLPRSRGTIERSQHELEDIWHRRRRRRRRRIRGPSSRSRRRGWNPRPSEGFSLRRGIATAVLATGLLVLGGAAVVNAADPSTSPTPSSGTEVAPDATTTPSQTDPSQGGSGTQPDTQGQGRGHHGAGAGAQGGTRGDCPNMGGDQGSNGGTTPTTPAPSTAPSGDPSDV